MRDRGNFFVSEWFDYRTYPTVCDSSAATRTQGRARCPFLSATTGVESGCVKARSSSGVCAINNASNGVRQDWLVCPYRALDARLLEQSVRRSFDVTAPRRVVVMPATALADTERRAGLLAEMASGALVVVYLQNKFGGEIALRATPRSPELSFDITFSELLPASGGRATVGRFGALEVQTMDFHGSYRHAVQNLADALRLHDSEFPRVLQENSQWLSDRIEGPNIANVFKRTFYQMMLKFQLGMHPRSVGAALAIPQAVWDSWQPHLGQPKMEQRLDGTYLLQVDGTTEPKAWIHVFDLDASADVHPNPVVIRSSILTDARSIAHYALTDVPRHAFAEEGSAANLVQAIERRLSTLWSGIAL